MTRSAGPPVPPDLDAGEQALRTRLAAAGSVAVAFSGGVDSACLAAVAVEELGDRVVGLTADTPLLSSYARAGAADLAAHIGLSHRFVPVDVLALEPVRGNHQDRCYHCKRAILQALGDEAERLGAAVLADGSNVDDRAEHRPGRRALAASRAVSPLEEAGFGKAHVRALAYRLGLPNWNAPADACCATRFPTGTELTPEALRRAADAEAALHRIGLSFCRVRMHDTIARIETTPDDLPRLTGDLREEALAELHRLGFRFVTVDLAGYRTGSMSGAPPSAAER